MILMYHKVDVHCPTEWWVSVDSFYQQMLDLQSKKVVYLDDYEISNEDQVVITFDGVYQNVLKYAAPIMKWFGYPFELFISGDYIGKGNEFDSVEPEAQFASLNELEELVALGGRIQWHTNSHPNLSKLDNAVKIASELEIDAQLLRLDPKGYQWFAYPHGEFNTEVKNEVRKRFKGALSCYQGDDEDIYELNRVTVLEDSTFSRPTISVIISSYNYGRYLVEAVESVLRQTMVPDQIIITDDCSSDDTKEIAEEYVLKYPDLIIYNRNKENLGVVKNFNRAIEFSETEFVMFLGADNRLVSNYVEDCYKTLVKNKSVGIAYTDYALFGQRAKDMYLKFPDSFKGGVKLNFYLVKFPIYRTKEDAIDAISKFNFIHGSSMYRREAFNKVGGYKEKEDLQEDYNLFKEILIHGWVASKVTTTLLEYRQHSKDQLNNRFDSYALLRFYQKRCARLEVELSYWKRLNLPLYKLLRFLRYGKQIITTGLKVIRSKGLIGGIMVVKHKIFR